VGEPKILPGGQGGTWRVGELVLKPAHSLPETVWRSEVLESVPESEEFRVARPVRTADGEWVADGWEACEFVPGHTDVSRQDDVLRAGAAFHDAVAGLPRPEFLDLRDNPWSHGAHVAWSEESVAGSPPYEELVAALVTARRPVALRSQLVHGDLPGNVLFADGLPPAVIDWSAYWRPPAWASAVAVVDALCWYDAMPDLAASWSHLPEWGQMLIRALLYRITTDDIAHGSAIWTRDRIATYRRVIDLAISYADRSRGGE
jgi:uncharacterized protein (TIGR02569 family)